jgi:S-adenosylmethionine-dependent methyltransferase
MPTVTFGHDVRALTPAEVEAALAAAGCTVSDRFGIRCVTDYVLADERKSDPEFYAGLERLELALCDRPEFMGTARMWQLVARRQGAEGSGLGGGGDQRDDARRDLAGQHDHGRGT